MGESATAQEHVLFFHDVAGAPHVERHPTLALAVQRVEQLANDEGVTDSELFALAPVRLQRQQRWHVAVEAAVPAPRTSAPSAPPAPPPAAPPAPPRQVVADHTDALDVEVVDEVFHEVVRDVVRDAASDGPLAEAPDSADVLPSSPRGRGLGFFVHQ